MLPCIVRNGLKGNVMITGKTFDDAMPAVSLTPIETAQVLTYISNSFGNKLGLITGDEVGIDLDKCGN